MYNSKIIVTVNPGNWEGDFRLWETMSSGALVFVDPLFVPHPFPLEDGIHVIFFNNQQPEDLIQKLNYYLSHPVEARRIAISGYLHALKYHRTINLVDYVLRSSHLKAATFKYPKTTSAGNSSELIDRNDQRSVNYFAQNYSNYYYTGQYFDIEVALQADEIKLKDAPGKYLPFIMINHTHLNTSALGPVDD